MSNAAVPPRAAIWARVSTAEQRTENQLAELRTWAADLDVNVVTEYVTEDSAWAKPGRADSRGREFETQRQAMLMSVRQGRHPVVLCWAIDRLSRQGTEDMTRYLRLLAEAGADVRSRHDSWLNTADPFAREILIGVFATLAKYESQRRSDRIKAGLARRKAEGKPIGRQPGATDVRPRRRSGYVARWERERKALTAAWGRAGPDPDVIRGIERVTGETYDAASGEWTATSIQSRQEGGS